MTAACPYCKKPPGEKVGPPALVRCITPDCAGSRMAAMLLSDWNAAAKPQIMETFEREALNQLVLTTRSMASLLGDDSYAVKLKIWAQIVEEWLEKVDGKAEHDETPRQ